MLTPFWMLLNRAAAMMYVMRLEANHSKADEPFPHLNAAEVAQRSLDKMAQGYLAELDRLIDSAR